MNLLRGLLYNGVDLAANVALAGMTGALVYGVISSMSRKPQQQMPQAKRWKLAEPELPMLSFWQGPPHYFSQEALRCYGSN